MKSIIQLKVKTFNLEEPEVIPTHTINIDGKPYPDFFELYRIRIKWIKTFNLQINLQISFLKLLKLSLTPPL